jgi:hypothetical protein
MCTFLCFLREHEQGEQSHIDVTRQGNSREQEKAGCGMCLSDDRCSLTLLLLLL